MRECRQCDVAAWFRGGSAEAKGRARRRWNEATNAGREMPWLGIIVATLYALEYESRIPTDRPPARSRRLPTPRYSNHVAIQGSITKLSGTTRPRRRRRRPRRAFSPFRLRPTNGSRRAIERPPPLSICIPHRYAKKECLRHPRHPRTEAISLSRNEAFSSTSAFLRNRTPSREGKGTPSRGEWPYQRFLVSRPGKRNWIDGRTGVGAICVEILESPFPILANSNIFTR